MLNPFLEREVGVDRISYRPRAEILQIHALGAVSNTSEKTSGFTVEKTIQAPRRVEKRCPHLGGTMRTGAARSMRCAYNNSGLASFEAVLFSVFFLVPILFLSLAIMQRSTAIQSAVASARHGAFRSSMDGAKHYEDRIGRGGRSYVAETEVKRHIAYFPPVTGAVLQNERTSGDRVKTRATMRVSSLVLDYDRQLNSRTPVEERTECSSSLTMLKRHPSHYDNSKGKAHQAAVVEIRLFTLYIKSLQIRSGKGPIPFTAL